MMRTVLRISLALLSSSFTVRGWPQGITPQTAKQILDATLADMRGQRELMGASGPENWNGPRMFRFSLPGDPSVSHEPAATVSAQRLRHRPPKEARQACEKAARTKDLQKAAALLESAVRIDSAFAEAHNNLGLVYANLGRFPEALAELQRAIELIPHESIPRSNLALVQKAAGVQGKGVQ